MTLKIDDGTLREKKFGEKNAGKMNARITIMKEKAKFYVTKKYD